MLALAVVATGAIGATAVFNAAAERHRADTEAIRRFERIAVPLAARASAIAAELPAVAADSVTPRDTLAARVDAYGAELLGIRAGLLGAVTADFLEATILDLVAAVGSTTDAVSELQTAYAGSELVDLSASLRAARGRFEAARAKHQRLRCRARMPSCGRPVGY